MTCVASVRVPDTALLNPMGFLRDRSIFCSNEVTLGGCLGGFRMGAGHQRAQALIRSLELSALLSDLQGVNDSINSIHIMKWPQNSLNYGIWRGSM